MDESLMDAETKPGATTLSPGNVRMGGRAGIGWGGGWGGAGEQKMDECSWMREKGGGAPKRPRAGSRGVGSQREGAGAVKYRGSHCIPSLTLPRMLKADAQETWPPSPD